jgi:hypothetical protein
MGKTNIDSNWQMFNNNTQYQCKIFVKHMRGDLWVKDVTPTWSMECEMGMGKYWWNSGKIIQEVQAA